MKNKEFEHLLKLTQERGKLISSANQVFVNQHGTYPNEKALEELIAFDKDYFHYKDEFFKKHKIVVKTSFNLIQAIKSWF